MKSIENWYARCAQTPSLSEAAITTAPLAPFLKSKDYQSPPGSTLANMGPYSQATKVQKDLICLTAPQVIFDQASSCAIYATKPVIDPVMAIAPLAVTEPVKIKLMSIIVNNPQICQLNAFVTSLNFLSINQSLNEVLCFHWISQISVCRHYVFLQLNFAYAD